MAKGKREDHDSLPPEIQALWDDNAAIYKRLKDKFEECKSLNDKPACDRYLEHPQQACAVYGRRLLAASPRQIRKNLDCRQRTLFTPLARIRNQRNFGWSHIIFSYCSYRFLLHSMRRVCYAYKSVSATVVVSNFPTYILSVLHGFFKQ